MRPTFSILCFTVLTGLGYGAWFLIGLGLALGSVCGAWTAADGSPPALCAIPLQDAAGFLVAFALVGAGLLCSLGHLGKPQRAWRALSQWRSSWLSREGIAALLTFVPAILLFAQELAKLRLLSEVGLLQALEPRWWNGPCWNDVARPALGLALAFGAALTVFCTANIYASLKPIRAWRDRHVVPAYLLLGLYGGSLLLSATGTIGWTMQPRRPQLLLVGTIVLAIACAWLKSRYWRSIDAAPATSAGHASGLESLGSVRSFEQPHTEENYLTHEMGFVLARKHARKLRTIAAIAAFLLPALLAALGLLFPAALASAVWLALASALLGLLIERWLFFAEAKHAVMGFYGR